MKKKILTALITPFDNDFHIDFPALQWITGLMVLLYVVQHRKHQH